MKWWLIYYMLLAFLIPYRDMLAVSRESEWWTHFAYMLGHAGWLHYMLNGIGWLAMRKIITPARTVTACIIGWFIPATDMPVLGWSVVLYYYMGLCLATMRRADKWRLIGIVAIGFLMPWIAAWHHAIMLAAGWMIRKVEVSWQRTLR